MRKITTKLSAVALVLLFLMMPSANLVAQTSDRPNNIQLYGTALSYKGELGNQFWESTSKGGGLSYYRLISPSFDAGLDLTYNRAERNLTRAARFEGDMISAMLALKLKMYGTILKEDALIGPYLVGKFGVARLDFSGIARDAGGAPFAEKGATAIGAAGAGIRIRITDAISLFGETTWMATASDNIDGVDNDDWEQFLEHRGGIGINLGKSKDTDMDGVPDRRDKCPDTPTGVQVDKEGCPVDTDGDGVADYQDECPTEAGVANLKGCPDRDN
ncbi:thrombospondin type 3 repeat-containing protein, partial [Pontibacter locisalis]